MGDENVDAGLTACTREHVVDQPPRGRDRIREPVEPVTRDEVRHDPLMPQALPRRPRRPTLDDIDARVAEEAILYDSGARAGPRRDGGRRLDAPLHRTRVERAEALTDHHPEIPCKRLALLGEQDVVPGLA